MTDTTESRGKAVKTVEGVEMLRLGDIVFLSGYGRGLSVAIQIDECPFTAGCIYINPSNEMIITYKNGVTKTFKFRHLPNDNFLYVLPSGRTKELDAPSVQALLDIWKQYKEPSMAGR